VTGDYATHEEVVDFRFVKTPGSENPTTLLFKNHNVEILRLFLPEQTNIPTYEAAGEVILQCISGQVSLVAGERTHVLRGGQLIYLGENESFSIHAVEDSHLLATLLVPTEGPPVKLIGEQDDV